MKKEMEKLIYQLGDLESKIEQELSLLKNYGEKCNCKNNYLVVDLTDGEGYTNRYCANCGGNIEI